MKDPCLECLVQVTCWQECDDKRNYAVLIANAIRNYRGTTRNNSILQKQFKNFLNQSTDHIIKRNAITRRASLMSKDK